MGRHKSRIVFIASAILSLALLFSACSPHRLLTGAILSKNVGRVRILLDGGVPANARYAELQMTPLMTAAIVGTPEITQLLIEHGAEVNARDTDGQTALHMAAGRGYCETAKVLVANGADVNARAAWRVTPLMDAVIRGNAETVKCLTDLRADPNLQADAGTTALNQAVWRGDPEIVKILLDAGADVSIKDERGETARDVVADLLCSGVRDKHSEEIQQMLRAADAGGR